MRDRLIFLWNLRQSPDRRVRYGWYPAVTVGLLMALALPWPRSVIVVAMGTMSVFYTIAAILWSVVHPRSLLPAAQTTWRWAAWLTVIGVVGFYAGALQWATGFLSFSIPAVGMLSGLLVVLPFLFLLLALYGGMGAAVAAFTARQWPERSRLVAVGANGWWLWSLAVLAVIVALLFSFQGRDTGPMQTVAALSIPLATALLCTLARNPKREPRRIAERLLQKLSRYLTFRRRWRKHKLVIDLRGAVLGLLVSALVFGLLRPLLKAPSASWLVGMIQLRNQEALGAWGSAERGDAVGMFGDLLAQSDQAILARRRQIVLIDLDTPVLRQAFAPSPPNVTPPEPRRVHSAASTPSRVQVGNPPDKPFQSEFALDAVLIRRLHALGASVVVLFPPQEFQDLRAEDKPKLSSNGTEAKGTDTKRPNTSADVHLLAEAIKKAGNVVLALPTLKSMIRTRLPTPARTQTPDVKPVASELRVAARASAGEGLFSYGSVRLPVLPQEDAQNPHSLPLTVAQIHARMSQSNAIYGFKGHFQTLIDFNNAKPDQDFLHIAASALVMPATLEKMGEEAIPTPDGQWSTLGTSIRGNIVFLDTRRSHLRETPIGALPLREVLAYATATVLAHNKGLRVSTTNGLLLTLLVGH